MFGWTIVYPYETLAKPVLFIHFKCYLSISEDFENCQKFLKANVTGSGNNDKMFESHMDHGKKNNLLHDWLKYLCHPDFIRNAILAFNYSITSTFDSTYDRQTSWP